MARKKDLAGLAALAGLAYMMTRDKAQKGEAPTASAPTAASSASKTAEVDPLEAANASAESQQIMTDAMAAGKKSLTASPPRAAATRSVAAPAAADGTAPLAYKDDFGMGKMSKRGSGSGGQGSTLVTLKADNGGRRSHPEYPEDARAALKRDEADTARDLIRGQKGYAKGGSVKGWGMARGARKAKTY